MLKTLFEILGIDWQFVWDITVTVVAFAAFVVWVLRGTKR